MNNTDFSAQLQTLMGIKSMSQADIVKATGISRSLVSDYVNGRKSPALSNANALADALGVTLDELSGRQPVAESPAPPHFPADVLEVARAYAALDEQGKAMIRGALGLPALEREKSKSVG